jgi:hypothetical protein
VQKGILTGRPPYTETPVYQEENRTKPPQMKAISARTELMQPDEVARALIKGMERGRFVVVDSMRQLIEITMRILATVQAC